MKYTSLQALYDDMSKWAWSHPSAEFLCADHSGYFGWIAWETIDGRDVDQQWDIAVNDALRDGIPTLTSNRKMSLTQLVEDARGECLRCKETLMSCACHVRGI